MKMRTGDRVGGVAQSPTKILVIGGSYAGVAATVTLLDLCHGRTSMKGVSPADKDAKVHYEITLVDERDGFCKPGPSSITPPVQLTAPQTT